MTNRDAGDKFRGFTLQKARAVYSLLRSINRRGIEIRHQFYLSAAVEADDDVAIVKGDGEYVEKIFEQNKDLQSKGNLTLNSKDVQKSIVNFIDVWIHNRKSEATSFIFYTTCGIGKERETEKTKELGIVLPAEPILELLKNHILEDSFLETIIIPYMSSMYSDAYQDIEDNRSAILEDWDIEKWKIFLGQIEWSFSSMTVRELDEKILDEIRACPLFRSSLSGREKSIAALIEQHLERLMANPDYVQRFMHLSDIKMIFTEAEMYDTNLDDYSGELLDKIQVDDLRDLSEKLTSVCPSLDTRIINLYKLFAAETLIEEGSQANLRPYKSEKYQIYTAIEEYLINHYEKLKSMKKEELQSQLEIITNLACNRILTERADYHYPFSNKVSIKNLVFGLFDQCYIAFDGDSPDES